MKKKMYFIVLLLFILFFYGCKEEVEPVVPVASKLTIQVNQSGPGLVAPSGVITALKGETLTLKVDKEIGVVSTATLNGTEIPLKNGIYYVPVISNGTVNVDFKKTPKWQLAKHPWYYFSREVRNLSDNKYLYTAYVSDNTGLKYTKLFFTEDSIKGYDIAGKRIEANPYKLIDEKTIIMGDDFKLTIVELTDSTLVYSAPSQAYELDPETNEVRRAPEKDRLFIETFKK